MTRKPLFWIVFLLLSIAAAFYAFEYFPKAFPLVNLNISMNRQQALAEAAILAEKNAWGPVDFDQAASFSQDTRVQHFVELEAGGVEKFNQLLDGSLYSPFRWVVRHYKENEETETRIQFTPDGRFYGFSHIQPESETGASMPMDSALVIAETSAAAWNIDLSPYVLVEKSQEKQIGGRTDFSFIYERTDEKLGEAFYRLELRVGGDELTAIRHFVKIPQAFDRRYQEMRSANDTLASVAMFAIAILYGILGIGVGLFFLLRERWLKWRTALFWGCFIALLQVLVMVNEWPLVWMSYDTALSHNSFFMRQVVQLMTLFFAEAALLTLTFMAAEGLTRKAFPNQIQLWKIWKPDAASTKPVLGFTLTGYLAVSLFFAFDIFLYFVATKGLGWWSPSSSLFEPNVLATYQPWLSSIAYSLHAGFWEECLFRAVPIAGAALIGRKVGKPALWIIGAFVLQSVIFGAGHANYPMQPFYARLVELIIPSIAFGLLYIYFGLLPAIILHFAYDVVWFALPLFVASSPQIWLQQLLVILFTLTPIFVVLWGRLRKKAWLDEVPADLKNSAFQPPAPKTVVEPTTPVETTTTIRKSLNLWFGLVGFVALVAWFFFTSFENAAPPLNVSRSKAEKIADAELAARDIALGADWKQLSRVEAPLNENDRFIWQQEGDSVYSALINSYLGGPHWFVRYATFEGDVAARAEEYSVKVMRADKWDFSHTLPEKAPGDSLDEASARGLAETAVAERFDADPLKLKLVSATPSKLENRTDWRFVWADTANHPLESGECRLVVQLSGSEVTSSYQMVYVPEEWSRAEREKNNLRTILDYIMGAAPILLLVVALVFAIISWSRKKFNLRLFLKLAILITFVTVLNVVNSWPSVKSMFVTAAPWMHQSLIAIIFSALGAVVVGVTLGMVNGYIRATRLSIDNQSVKPVAALGAGVLIVAAATVVHSFAPSLSPTWARYSALGSRWPILDIALGSIVTLFVMGTAFLIIFSVADRFTHAWSRRKIITAVIIFVLGFVLTDVSASGTIAFWLLNGAVKGVLLLLSFVLIFRHRLSLTPLIYLPVLVLKDVKHFVLDAYPGAQIGSVSSIAILIVVTLFWIKWMSVERA